jgi:hypothetical protein
MRDLNRNPPGYIRLKPWPDIIPLLFLPFTLASILSFVRPAHTTSTHLPLNNTQLIMLFLPGHPTFGASPASATGKEKKPSIPGKEKISFTTRLIRFFFSSWSDADYASGVEAYVSRKCGVKNGEGKKAEANKSPRAQAEKTSKLNAEANRSVSVKERNGFWTRVVERDGVLQVCVEEYRLVYLFIFILRVGCGLRGLEGLVADN